MPREKLGRLRRRASIWKFTIALLSGSSRRAPFSLPTGGLGWTATVWG